MSLSQELGRTALLQGGILDMPLPTVIKLVLDHTVFHPQFEIDLAAIELPAESLRPIGDLSEIQCWWEWDENRKDAPSWWRDPHNGNVSNSISFVFMQY